MFDIESLKNAIRSEGGFELSEEILDRFLSMGRRVQLKAKAYIVEPGTVDKSVWITASGVTTAVYFDGKKEYVLGFSGPGTISMSPISYVIGKPAFCGFQAITNCDMVNVSKSIKIALGHIHHVAIGDGLKTAERGLPDYVAYG